MSLSTTNANFNRTENQIYIHINYKITIITLAEYTTDVITLCESGGYDTIIVESVGVGQNEVEVDEVVDLFVLVVNPGGGDDLQASKKGIVLPITMIMYIDRCYVYMCNANYTIILI